MSLPGDFRFHHRLRVRWAEVDAQQVVFNGHYLTYLDVASSDYWRAVGLPYPDAFKHAGGDIFVRRNTLEYHAPAPLDDLLDNGIRPAGRSSPVPDSLRAQLDAGEQGRAVHDVQLGAWNSRQVAARAVRTAVFVEEQGIPASQEWDADDASAVHAVVTNLRDLPLGTGRPILSGEAPDAGHEHARIGRMAVLRSSRGAGLARLLPAAPTAD